MKTFTFKYFILLSIVIVVFTTTVYGQKDSMVTKHHKEIQQDTVKGAGYYFDAGTDKAQAGDCVAAIDLYDKCISMDPNTFDAYYNRAYCKMHLNDYEAAISDFTTCMRLHHGPYADALYLRGSCFNQLKQYDLAIADFSKAMEVSSNPDIYAARGLAYLKKQDFRSAVADYNYAIAKNPSKTELYGNRAVCNYGIHKLKEAITDADFFLSQNQPTPEVLEAELRAKFELGDYAGALACAKDFIKLEKTPVAYYYAGLMSFNLQKYKEAIGYFSSAIAVDNNYRDAYYSRALCYFGLNDTNNGCIDVKKAKQLGFPGVDPKIESYCNGQKQK